MASTTTANALMRTKISDKITKTFEQDAILLDMFMQGRAQANNSLGAGIAAYVGVNPSFQSLTESAYFPAPGETTDVLMKVYNTDQSQTGHISGRLLDIPDELMLEGALSLATKRDTLTFKKKLNQMCYGDGSGSKGTVTAITTGVGGTATFGGSIGASQILKGARYNFYTTAGVIHVTGIAVSTVTDVNVTTGVVTFDSVPTNGVVGDILVPEGSYGMAFYGLAYHVNDATGDYQGLTAGRTNYPTLRATVIDAAGGALSVALIDRMLRTLRVVGGVNAPMDDLVMISHPDQELAYRTLGYALTRTVSAGGNAKLDLGFPMVAHNGLRWKLDNDCPRDRIYFIRLSTFQRFMNRNLGLFVDENGASLHLKPGSGVHAWDYLYYFLTSGNIACLSPNSNGVIKNLALVA